MVSTRTRLLNNIAGETLSDRHKISLMEETSPRIINDEESCKVKQCQDNLLADANISQESLEQEDQDSQSDQVI